MHSATAGRTAKGSSWTAPSVSATGGSPIIDLSSAADQPMESGDGRFALTYNGEVYNFRALRRELEGHGRRFRSHSDTEVVLEALAQWGEDALSRLNGMFAFALWDRQERELLLVRDRYGVKPLYYTQAGNAFLFASEIKALLQHPGLAAEVDFAGMAEYFTFQNFFSDRTLFAGISMLPAGCLLRIRAGVAEAPRIERYWDYDFREPEAAASEGEYEEELAWLFRQAVERQLVSDVEVGAYLSGGIDSGSITAVAARYFPTLKSFTVGFDMSSTASGLEQFFDERVNAERLSHLCTTEHYEMVLKAGDMERCIGDLVWHLEEPRVGQSYPNYYAARLASRFGKVVLSGTGGDELFGGYPWRYYRAVVNDDFEHYIDKYYQLLAAAGPEQDPARDVSARGRPDGGGLDARYLPRRLCLPCRRARPAGGLRQSLALSRGQDLPARAPGGGGQALHGALAGEPGTLPRQRLGRLRHAAARGPQARQSRRGGAAQRERAGTQDEEVFRAHKRRQAAAAQGAGAPCRR